MDNNAASPIVEGIVIENLPNTIFRVKISGQEQPLLCNMAGKMKLNWVRLLPGDKVRVEINPYDPTRGRIIFKIK